MYSVYLCFGILQVLGESIQVGISIETVLLLL